MQGGLQSTSISKAGWGKSDGKAAEEALVELAFSMWLNAIRSWNAEATTMVSSISICGCNNLLILQTYIFTAVLSN